MDVVFFYGDPRLLARRSWGSEGLLLEFFCDPLHGGFYVGSAVEGGDPKVAFSSGTKPGTGGTDDVTGIE